MKKNSIRLSNESTTIVLSLHEGRVAISSTGIDHKLLSRVISATREFESSNMNTLDDLKAILTRNGFKAVSRSEPHASEKNRFSNAIHFASDKRSPVALSQQTKEWDISSAPFRSETLKSAYMRLDTREPKEVLELLEKIRIKSCVRMPLDVGDIHIGDMVSDDLLIIERKTVSDLYNSTVSTHLHDQAQRLSEYRAERKGLRTMIVWIIEGEYEGVRGLYNAFPQTKQTDGLVNYLTAIHQHHVLTAYNKHHLAYLVAKLAQGFLEGRLYYGLGDGRRVDANSSVDSANTSLAKMLQAIPGITVTTAKSIIENDISLAELSRYTIKELKALGGVGDKNAAKIYNSLRMKSSP